MHLCIEMNPYCLYSLCQGNSVVFHHIFTNHIIHDLISHKKTSAVGDCIA